MPGDLGSALGIDDAAALVGDHPAPLVERNAVEPDPLVADRAEHDSALDCLALAGVARADRSGFVAMKLVARHDDPLDLAVALELDWRTKEPQHDPSRLSLGLSGGEVGEDLDVLAGRDV